MPKPSPETSKILDADWNTIPFDAAALKILQEGDTALKLNPDDPTVSVAYGSQLVALGEVDKGKALLDGLQK